MFLGYELLNLGFCSVWEWLLPLRLEDPGYGPGRQGKLEELSGLCVSYIARQMQKASFAEGAEEKGEKKVLWN